MLEFTKALYELFVRQGNTLSNSLLIMKAKPKKDKVSRAAETIFVALENGSLFSNALRACGVLAFDDVYISFINIAEKNGDLKTALSYLKEKLEREAECKKKVTEASVYPAFVILLSIAASIFIGLYTDTADFVKLGKYISFLICVCFLLYFALAKILGENCLFEAFTAVDFLVKNGIELSEAVGCAIQIAGPSTRNGKLFENAREKISYGMDLQTAFQFGKKTVLWEAFYYADTGDCKDDLFGRIAAYLKSKKEHSQTICILLIEPVFIVVAGIFILLLLMTFFMPMINEASLL